MATQSDQASQPAALTQHRRQQLCVQCPPPRPDTRAHSQTASLTAALFGPLRRLRAAASRRRGLVPGGRSQQPATEQRPPTCPSPPPSAAGCGRSGPARSPSTAGCVPGKGFGGLWRGEAGAQCNGARPKRSGALA
eukprot:286674-Chlamydomonas_euryale.AAC.1